jgi:hypothetical protein
MKQFYSIEPRYNLNGSNMKYENVEYDINTLIRDQAELCVDVDDDIYSDEEWDKIVEEKAQEIKKELMRNGIWRNEFGHLMFLYC